MKEIAGRLKLVRAHLGHSQRKMAAMLGVKYRSWQDYESGKNVPGGRVFAQIAGLGINTNWLLSGQGPMFLRGDGFEAQSIQAGSLMQGVAEALCGVMLEMAPTLTAEQKHALSRALSSLYFRLAGAPNDRHLLALLESFSGTVSA